METDLLPLRAGPLALWFQPEDARLRHICAGGVELIRGITAPVRDARWRTLPIRLENLHVERGTDRFRVSFDALCHAGDVAYRWRGDYEGSAAGELRLRFSGESLGEFRACRIGFCVLHPAEVAGRPLIVEHTDGRRTRGHFPSRISPHQPAQDIRALTVDHAPGLVSVARLKGDTFEMEDQRNWLDSSFKTYCTPLSRPHPVLILPGERVEQSVHLSPLHADTVPWIEPAAPPLPPAPRPAAGAPRPALGLAWPTDDATPLTPTERAALRALGLDHLRVDVRLDDAAALRAAQVGLAEAAAAGLPVELALHLDEANASAAEAWARAHVGEIARWIIVERGRPSLTDPRWPAALRAWRADHPPAPVIGGGDREFTALNRNPPPASALDGVSFGCTPQAHAHDERSILETLAMLPLVVAQAREIGGGRPVHVGVITLHPAGRSTAGEDPRLATALGAEWTRAAIEALTASGAASATFYTVRGVLAAPTLHPLFRASRPSA